MKKSNASGLGSAMLGILILLSLLPRSEERRVGKECGS